MIKMKFIPKLKDPITCHLPQHDQFLSISRHLSSHPMQSRSHPPTRPYVTVYKRAYMYTLAWKRLTSRQRRAHTRVTRLATTAFRPPPVRSCCSRNPYRARMKTRFLRKRRCVCVCVWAHAPRSEIHGTARVACKHRILGILSARPLGEGFALKLLRCAICTRVSGRCCIRVYSYMCGTIGGALYPCEKG